MANATRSVAPLSETDTCPCGTWAFRLDREHHDWLLSFEKRGVAGVADLIDYLDDADDPTVEGKLMWVDFQQFVAMHNWDQPAAVYTLASFIHSYIHFRNENNRNEDNRAAAARLAAIAAVAARVDAVEAKLTQYLSGRAAQSDDKLVDSSTGSC